MDRSFNRIELKGHLGQDPKVSDVGEFRVVKMKVATNEFIKDRHGNLKEETTWHTVVAWSGKGMPDFSLLKKGVCVSLTGRVRNNRYVTPEGEEKYYNDILASRLSVESTQ